MRCPLAASRLAVATAADKKPNVIVFLSDDVGTASTASRGTRRSPRRTSTRSPRTASGSRRATSPRPYCSPTRAGLHDRPLPDAVRPRVQRAAAPAGGKRASACRVEEKTIADRLKALGLRHRVRRQVAPRRRRRSSSPPPAGSTSSTAPSPTRRSSTRRTSSTPASRRTITPVKDDNFYTTDAYAERAVTGSASRRTSRSSCTCRSTPSTRRCRRRRSTSTASRTSRTRSGRRSRR